MAPAGRQGVASKARGSAAGLRARAARGLVRHRLTSRGGTSQRPLHARHARTLLPSLYRHTQGKPFRPQVLRNWLKQRLSGKGYRIPTAEEAARLLSNLARSRRINGEQHGPLGAWLPQGLRYVDPEGSSAVHNLQGFIQGPLRGPSKAVAWNEYGLVYRLRRASGDKAKMPGSASYEVVCTRAFKRLSCAVERKTLVAPTDGKRPAEFKNSLVLEPRRLGLGRLAPQWSFIYLHSFSSTGAAYADFPHYFGVSGAPVRVVLPTAPRQEQTCFRDWMVWRGEKLQWRRIKFNSWFDYLTDRAGKCENDFDLHSLLEMRSQLHALIRKEVKKVGGDPKRVIVGGASQGCCVALDAAMTYPEELGGVIGLVGHVLGSTPLDPAKRKMPLHLFHEASDREMKWSWVQGTVQRLVDAGFNVTSRREIDPSGSGHWIQEIEGQWIRTALRRILHASSSP